MSLTLLIVDDHELMRQGLARLTEGTEIQIVAEASSGQEAIHLSQSHNPDLILINIGMADRNGIKTLELLKQNSPDTPLLVLSDTDIPSRVSQVKSLGALGCLSIRCSRHELLAAIRKAAQGEAAWTEKQKRLLTGPLPDYWMDSDAEIPLTRRQSEVLRQLALGLTTKEIARTLNIRYDTAKEHVQNTIRKIGVTGRTQAAVWAVRRGLV